MELLIANPNTSSAMTEGIGRAAGLVSRHRSAPIIAPGRTSCGNRRDVPALRPTRS